MAHIVEFSVEGLAGRPEPFSRKLNRDVNIFFGLNGSGKTSLLRILHSAMAGDSSLISIVPFKRAKVVIYSIQYNKHIVYSIEKKMDRRFSKDKSHRRTLGPSKRVDELQFVFEPTSREEDEFRWVTDDLPSDAAGKWRHTYLPTWRYFGSTAPDTLAMEMARLGKVNIEYQWDILFARKITEVWRQYNNQVLSQVSAIQAKGLADILKAAIVENVGKGRETARKHLESKAAYTKVVGYLRRYGLGESLKEEDKFAERYQRDRKFKKLVDNITKVEQETEKATKTRDDLEQLIATMFTGGKKMIFKNTGVEVQAQTGENLELAMLSSGEKQVIRIFLEAMLSEENTILIDEPEISLHIDWQKVLISSMMKLNPKAQIIIATHSPDIMGSISDDRIFRL